MKNKINDAARLNHIIDAILEIEQYVANESYNSFIQNSMIQSASIRQLEIIGEASNHLSENITNELTEVEWHEIVGLRNLLIHDYFGIDLKIVWDVIQIDVPNLKRIIQEYNKRT